MPMPLQVLIEHCLIKVYSKALTSAKLFSGGITMLKKNITLVTYFNL